MIKHDSTYFARPPIVVAAFVIIDIDNSHRQISQIGRRYQPQCCATHPPLNLAYCTVITLIITVQCACCTVITVITVHIALSLLVLDFIRTG